jgi:phospholipid/cholesterol/gamma-HCH transport system substrate-binding protein
MYEVKKQLAWSALKVGTVITVGLVTLLVTVFFAGNIGHILSPKEILKFDITDVGGLRRGAPVWFAGLEVGAVKSIDLHPQYGTVVTILINRDVLKYIRKDARAVIQTMGLLGDKYVELGPGTPGAPQLTPGAMISGTSEINMQKVMATGAVSLQKLNEVIEHLGSLAVKIEKGEGTLALLLSDPSLYNNLKDASARIANVAADVQNRKGTLGKIIEDDALYDKLLSTADSLESFSFTLKNNKGTLNRLIEDSTLYDRLVSAASSVEKFGLKLNSDKGTLNRLAEDPRLYENLVLASEHLSSILQSIDSGKGTAGTLVRDEELARELADTVRELRELTADIRRNPGNYFKFSVF